MIIRYWADDINNNVLGPEYFDPWLWINKGYLLFRDYQYT